MWQFPQHEEILQLPGVRSVALAQVDFGAESVKPTRLLMRTSGQLHPEMYEGLPHFDGEGWYLGPLPKKAGKPLIGKQGGAFRTAEAAAWPSGLCSWVADQILAAFRVNSESRGGQVGEEKKRGADMEVEDVPPAKRPRRSTVEEDPLETNPFDPPVKGGQGLPRRCTWKGNAVPFHDGGCLMSPGRWEVDKRNFPQEKEWRRLRLKLRSVILEAAGGETCLEKECFAMATGEKGCRLVQDESVRQQLLSVLEEFCRSKGASGDVLRVAEGQPFRLELMRLLLEYAGDKDCDFLATAEVGLPLGVKNPLPRTPSAFERQVEWALKYDPLVACLKERPNYPSAKEHEAHLRSHLEEEVKEGLMDRMSRPEFEQKFGEERAVAALAVLVEDEITGKRRVIHDGSHGVRVNHRIRCQDKLRMPGGREKRFLLNRFRRARDVVFS